jgi:hypothetical protein
MNFTKNLFKTEKKYQNFLAVLFAIYIIFDIQTPAFLASMVDTMFGKIVVILIALSMFTHSGPVAGALGIVAAYELIKRSSVSTGSYGVQHYLPSEHKKCGNINAMNQFPITLEEMMVQKMAPLVRNSSSPNYNFKPVLNEGVSNAAPINYQGVI